jgi:hypothetical protein
MSKRTTAAQLAMANGEAGKRSATRQIRRAALYMPG